MLDDETTAMLRLWLHWRRGEAGHLPFAGGTAEQPACVMAALAIMDAAERAIRPKRRGQEP